MDLTVATYLLYLAVTGPLTVWVARALQRHGKVFLIDVFHGDERLASAVNHLLVIGFYLLNLGYVTMFLTMRGQVDDARELLEVLSAKVGGVAIVLGLVHLGNVWAFNALRRRALMRARALPPIAPNGYTTVAPLAAATPMSWAAPDAPAR
jgi:uncharacterized membrane protein